MAADPERPRIGLVLGGGGAAGVAHVGVIQALEELGIRPDVVTGTSMGAIVGGLYAAGFSPDELGRAVTEIDWANIFNDKSDRSLLHPLRRDSRLDPLVQSDLPIGLSANGISVDAGVIDAVKLSLTLRRLAARAEGISDFDELPIPFRAIATDLVTGEPVVLGTGDLSRAIRASMSIPGLFPPVEIDGRVLVDGGVVNNLPMDVARALGADVLIVSNIPSATVTPEDVGSLTAALAQTLSIMIAANAKAQIATLEPGDVLLVPDVGAVGVLAFDEARDTVSTGLDAVRAAEPALRRIAAGRGPLAPLELQADLSGEIRYDRIAIEYDGDLDTKVLRAMLNLPEEGPVPIEEIEIALRRLYGIGTIDDVRYRFETDGGERVLVVQAEPRGTGRFRPRLGIEFSDVFGDDADFTLSLGISATELNPLGGRLDFDGAVGSVDGARLRFEQPLNYGQTLFVRPNVLYFKRNGTLFAQPDVPLAEIEVESLDAGVELLWTPVSWGRFGIGVAYSREVSSTSAGVIPTVSQSTFADETLPLSVGVDFDTLDDTDLPRAGAQLGAILDFDLSDGGRPDRVQVDAVAAYSIGQNTVSPFFELEGGLGNDGFNPAFIGGFQRLSGFENGELIGNVVGVIGIRYYRRFGFDTLFGKETFIGASAEYGGAYADWEDVGRDGSFLAGSLFAGVETSLGPVILGFGAAETGQFSATLSLGARF
ncbi:MAG: patatin-like phospholipase family protein [Paracoccaceae bacterium]